MFLFPYFLILSQPTFAFALSILQMSWWGSSKIYIRIRSAMVKSHLYFDWKKKISFLWTKQIITYKHQTKPNHAFIIITVPLKLYYKASIYKLLKIWFHVLVKKQSQPETMESRTHAFFFFFFKFFAFRNLEHHASNLGVYHVSDLYTQWHLRL